MRESGLNEENIIEIDRNLEGGRQGIKRILAVNNRVSAIITGEDITAVGVIKELVASGFNVPGDLSVIGYNNSVLAQISTPTLTSVDNLQESMAKNSVQILYDVLQGEQVSKKTVLSPTLVIHESTARVKNNG